MGRPHLISEPQGDQERAPAEEVWCWPPSRLLQSVGQGSLGPSVLDPAGGQEPWASEQAEEIAVAAVEVSSYAWVPFQLRWLVVGSAFLLPPLLVSLPPERELLLELGLWHLCPGQSGCILGGVLNGGCRVQCRMIDALLDQSVTSLVISLVVEIVE